MLVVGFVVRAWRYWRTWWISGPFLIAVAAAVGRSCRGPMRQKYWRWHPSLLAAFFLYLRCGEECVEKRETERQKEIILL